VLDAEAAAALRAVLVVLLVDDATLPRLLRRGISSSEELNPSKIVSTTEIAGFFETAFPVFSLLLISSESESYDAHVSPSPNERRFPRN